MMRRRLAPARSVDPASLQLGTPIRAIKRAASGVAQGSHARAGTRVINARSIKERDQRRGFALIGGVIGKGLRELLFLGGNAAQKGRGKTDDA